MTRQDPHQRRRRQAARANLIAAGKMLLLLLLGVLLGYIAAQATEAPAPAEPPEPVTAQAVEYIPPPAPMPEAAPAEPEYLGEFTATAYCPCVKCCGVWSAQHPSRGAGYVQRTASGTVPTEGRTIAADWDVLPAGTEVLLNGHRYTVEDTGGAIRGNRVDIYFEDHQAALEWGVQKADAYREIAQ